MSEGKGHYNMRVSAPHRARAEKLIRSVQSQADLAALCGGEVTVGDVLRISLERGLRELESEDETDIPNQHGDLLAQIADFGFRLGSNLSTEDRQAVQAAVSTLTRLGSPA